MTPVIQQRVSILILTFSRAAAGAQVDLLHVGVPKYDHKGVSKG